MEFKTEDEIWDYIELHYDEKSRLIILDLESYYEIEYGNDSVRNLDKERYEKSKKKDSTGELVGFKICCT
jgi:hypothetical protein